MLTALEYLGSVGIGVTSPRLFRANDNKIYVVKLQNNRMGTKVLVNEYIAWWFGQRMGLCFPPSDLIEIHEPVIKKNPRLRAAGVKTRLHFASQYVHSNHYVSKNYLKKASNKSAMAGVMLFDHMFHNIDRTKNRKNLLVRYENETYVLYAIDNSHLFIRGRWNAHSLKKLATQITINWWRTYGWLLKHFLTAEDFVPYVAKVKEIKEQELLEFVKSIPEEWLSNESEREALLKYMAVRCKMVDDIADKLQRSISNIHGRTHFY